MSSTRPASPSSGRPGTPRPASGVARPAPGTGSPQGGQDGAPEDWSLLGRTLQVMPGPPSHEPRLPEPEVATWFAQRAAALAPGLPGPSWSNGAPPLARPAVAGAPAAPRQPPTPPESLTRAIAQPPAPPPSDRPQPAVSPLIDSPRPVLAVAMAEPPRRAPAPARTIDQPPSDMPVVPRGTEAEKAASAPAAWTPNKAPLPRAAVLGGIELTRPGRLRPAPLPIDAQPASRPPAGLFASLTKEPAAQTEPPASQPVMARARLKESESPAPPPPVATPTATGFIETAATPTATGFIETAATPTATGFIESAATPEAAGLTETPGGRALSRPKQPVPPPGITPNEATVSERPTAGTAPDDAKRSADARKAALAAGLSSRHRLGEDPPPPLTAPKPDARPARRRQRVSMAPAPNREPRLAGRLRRLWILPLLALAGLLAWWFNPFAAPTVNGVVSAPKLTLVAPADGRVAQILVTTGAQVEPDTELLVVDAPPPDERRRFDLTARLDSAHARANRLDRQITEMNAILDDLKTHPSDASATRQESDIRLRLVDMRAQKDAATSEARELDLLLANEAGRPHGRQPLKAGTTGLVWSIAASDGMEATRGMPLIEIADCSHLSVQLQTTPGSDQELLPGQTMRARIGGTGPLLTGTLRLGSGSMTREQGGETAAAKGGTASGLRLELEPGEIAKLGSAACPVGQPVAIQKG